MKGNLRNAVYHILQIRKPRIPFSIQILVKTLTFNRLATLRTSSLAAAQFIHGAKKDAPFLKLRQSMSYLIFSISILQFGCYVVININKVTT